MKTAARPAQDPTVKILKSLADPTRLGVVRRLSARPPGESTEVLCQKSLLSQPTLSHHLQRLVEAGVVSESKDGVVKSYKLNRALLERCGINVSKL
ncbi:helix-turn-helix transcriptional regulator [Candidatus Saccharibacteria bacterium]|nr:helix-turn-helix transcriptional regulator [Candidatus Saccharibacteria bacterium]